MAESSVSLKIDPREAAKALGDALERGATAGLLRAGHAIEARAKKYAPVDTGSLRSSIGVKKHSPYPDLEIRVGPNVESPEGAPYDVYQEFGTGIYAETRSLSGRGGKRIRGVITPRKARALRFRPQVIGPVQGSRWGKIISYSASGKGTKKSTKFNQGFVFAAFVRGTPPVRYMRRAIEETDIRREFQKGWSSVK